MNEPIEQIQGTTRYPLIKEMMDDLLYQWARDNYQEMLQLIYAKDSNEYADYIDLLHIFMNCDGTPLKDFILNSGLIENYRISVYQYCSEQITEYDEDYFDILNDNQLAKALLLTS